MSKVKYIINGTERTNLIQKGSLEIRKSASKTSEATFSFEHNTVYDINLGQDVKIYIDDILYFGGVIREIDYGFKKNDFKKFVGTIHTYDYKTILSRRTTTTHVTSEKAGNVVKRLIQLYLYEEGISEGTIEDGLYIEEYDAVCKNCYEIVDELAELSGYVWYVDEDKKLHFVAELPNYAAPFDIKPSVIDIRDLKFRRSLENYRNKQFIKGGIAEENYPEQGIVAGQTLVYYKQLNSEIATRQQIEGGSGIYGSVVEDEKIVTIADADKLASDLLKRYGHTLREFTFTTTKVGFDAGQIAYVDLNNFLRGNYLIQDIIIKDNENINDDKIYFTLTCVFKPDVVTTKGLIRKYIDELGKVIRKALEPKKAGKPVTVEDNRLLSDLGRVERLEQDVNGRFTKVVYYRRDGTKYMESILEGTSPNYFYRWEYYYDSTGTNVIETRKYQRYYDNLNNLIKEERIL